MKDLKTKATDYILEHDSFTAWICSSIGVISMIPRTSGEMVQTRISNHLGKELSLRFESYAPLVDMLIHVLDETNNLTLKSTLTEQGTQFIPSKTHRKKRGDRLGVYGTKGVVFSNGSIWLQVPNILELMFSSPLAPYVELYDMGCMFDSASAYEVLAKLAADIREYPKTKLVFCDTETFDPDTPGGPLGLDGFRGRVRMIQLYCPELYDKVLVFDFGPRNKHHSCNSVFRDLFQAVFDHSRHVIFHNALFDMMFLERQIGIEWTPLIYVIDTQILSQNMWAGIKQFRHSLGAACERVGIVVDKSLQTSDFGADLIPAQINYGADDVLTMEALYKELRRRYAKDPDANVSAVQTDCKFLIPLHQMRMRGYPVDVDALNDYVTTLTGHLETKSAEFQAATGVEFTCTKQLTAVFQEKYGVEAFPGTSKDVLNRNLDKPEVQILLECRFIAVRLAYANKIKNALIDGRVRGGFRVLATQGMGRTACTTQDGLFVQLQNPSKESKEYPHIPDIRKVFVAGEGKKAIIVDLCLDAATTKVPVVGKGIIPITSVEIGDTVYGYKDGRVVLTKVWDTVAYNYTGDMYNWKGHYITQSMTKGHRIVFADGTESTPEEIAAQEFLGYPANRGKLKYVSDLVTCAEPQSGGTNMDNLTVDEVRLLVAMAADGHYPVESSGACVFYLSRQDKFDRHMGLIERLGAKHTIREPNNPKYRWVIRYRSSPLIKKLRGIMPNKRLGIWILDLPLELRQAALEELQYWDGCKETHRNTTRENKVSNAIFFSTTDGEEANAVAMLALSCGRTVSGMNAYEDKNRANHQPLYKIRVVGNNFATVKGNGVKYRSPLWGKGKPHHSCYRKRYDLGHVEDHPVACLRTDVANFFIVTGAGRLELTGNCSAHLREAIDWSNQEDQIKLTLEGADNHSYNTAKIVASVPELREKYPELVTTERFKEILDDKTHPHSKTAKELRGLGKNGIYTSVNIGSKYSLLVTMAKKGIIVALDLCGLVIMGLESVIPNWMKMVREENKKANSCNYTIEELSGGTVTYEAPEVDEDDDWEPFAEEKTATTKKKDSGFRGNFGKVISRSGRMMYTPKYERQGKYGKYETTKINNVASHLVQSPEADIMKTAINNMAWWLWEQRRRIKPDNCWFSVIAHDEVNIVVDEDLAEEVATRMVHFIDAESKKYLKRLPLVETTPEAIRKCICNNWSEK